MLGGFEISAKILDEGFESGRIQQEGHGCFSRFELVVGYDDHQRCSFFDFVRAEISAKIFTRNKWEVFL
jgi:hypothetical protein